MLAPFSRVLVAYDGSAPAKVALASALSLGKLGAHIVAASVVDASTVIVPDVITTGYDPSGLLRALEDDAASVLSKAEQEAAGFGIEVSTRTLHGRPVAQLMACADDIGADLIAVGTHARTGMERVFMGSTAEGLLRSAAIPVMVVREATRPLKAGAPLARLLVAVDGSGPSDAAVELASRIARDTAAQLLFCAIADTRDVYEKAMTYGYDPAPLVRDVRTDGEAAIHRALKSAERPGSSDLGIVEEGEPAAALVAVAKAHNVDAIVMGTHGRRGLERFFVGSVAEHVARDGSVPVIVVRSSDRVAVRQLTYEHQRAQLRLGGLRTFATE